MKIIIYYFLLLALTSCAWVGVRDEVKKPDGSYRLKIQGNVFSGIEILEKFTERSTELCGKDNYYAEDITTDRFPGGHPTLEVILYCIGPNNKGIYYENYMKCLEKHSAKDCTLMNIST